MISPDYLWRDGTLFCSRNAAAGYGAYVKEGAAAFLDMFAQHMSGTGGQTFVRSGIHLPCCPTDEQAEVLIPDRIQISDVLGVVVSSEDQAEREVVRLELTGIDLAVFRFTVAPILFRKHELSRAIRNGNPPEENLWTGMQAS